MKRWKWLVLAVVILNAWYFSGLDAELSRPVAHVFTNGDGLVRLPVQNQESSVAHLENPTASAGRMISSETPPPKSQERPIFKPEAASMGDSLEKLDLPEWKIWKGIGISQKGQQPADAAVLGSLSGFALYTDPAGLADPSRFDLNYPMAVYDDRNHRAGIVTGTIIILLKIGVTWDTFLSAGQYDLSLIHAIPETRTYMVTSAQSPFDLAALKSKLASDSNVASTRTEVLSRNYVKN